MVKIWQFYWTEEAILLLLLNAHTHLLPQDHHHHHPASARLHYALKMENSAITNVGMYGVLGYEWLQDNINALGSSLRPQTHSSGQFPKMFILARLETSPNCTFFRILKHYYVGEIRFAILW